jgi:hypothetical protein
MGLLYLTISKTVSRFVLYDLFNEHIYTCTHKNIKVVDKYIFFVAIPGPGPGMTCHARTGEDTSASWSSFHTKLSNQPGVYYYLTLK